MGSWTHYTEEPQQVVPYGSGGVSVTPNGSAWANSSWVELTSGISSAIACVGIVCHPADPLVHFQSSNFRVDLGKGAASSEEVIATCSGVVGITSVWTLTTLKFGIPIRVAASTRLAVRLRKSSTHTDAWVFKLLYYELAAAGATFEQEGFRWRYDDGDEDGATFSAAQDEHSAASIGIKKRLRMIVNVTGTPSTEEFELQYRRVGSPTEDWRKVN